MDLPSSGLHLPTLSHALAIIDRLLHHCRQKSVTWAIRLWNLHRTETCSAILSTTKVSHPLSRVGGSLAPQRYVDLLSDLGMGPGAVHGRGAVSSSIIGLVGQPDGSVLHHSRYDLQTQSLSPNCHPSFTI